MAVKYKLNNVTVTNLLTHPRILLNFDKFVWENIKFQQVKSVISFSILGLYEPVLVFYDCINENIDF